MRYTCNIILVNLAVRNLKGSGMSFRKVWLSVSPNIVKIIYEKKIVSMKTIIFVYGSKGYNNL